MSLDDDFLLSYASSMGIQNIQDEENLDRSDLYTDLDQLEQIADAEFEQYMNRARSFPFNGNEKSLQHASIHSDYEILGEELVDKNAQDDDLWKRYMDNNPSDEHYNVKPLGNTSFSAQARSRNRSTSPGEYFGARSLPFNHDWQKDIQEEIDCTQSSSSSKGPQRSAIEKSLDSRFIGLPKSLGIYPKYELPEIELHHPYTQKQTNPNRSSVSSTRQQQCPSTEHRPQEGRLQNAQTDCSVRSLSNSITSSSVPHAIYTIEPSSHLHFLCELSSKTIYAKVIHLKLRNLSSTSVRNFSLFSAKRMLDFETNEGLILEHEVVEIKIKVRTGALVSYQRRHLNDQYPSMTDKILVLIDHQHVNELTVNIDFVALEDEDEEDEAEEDTEEKEKDDYDDDEEDDEGEQEQDVEEEQERPDEQALLLANRPKCRFCALEKGYPLYSLQ